MALFKRSKNKKKKSAIREWIDAALFAIIVATLIRTFIFEAYTIPTGSMERTLLINDYLFVSKFHYGARIPMTPLSVPLVHNVMPMSNGKKKSYTTVIQWKYKRLPGLSKIKRDDIVVFNYPEGDTVIAGRTDISYYDAVLEYGRDQILASQDIMVHPVDKRENYIKRCVGIAGDSIIMKDANLYVNGKLQKKWPHIQHTYYYKSNNNTVLNPDELEDFKLATADYQDNMRFLGDGTYIVNLSNIDADRVAHSPSTALFQIQLEEGTEPRMFVRDSSLFKWNRDNWGPIFIPKKGATVQLTPKNWKIYKRIIQVYEGNKVAEKDSTIYINDKPVTSYTFNMDYYWMMGDNRCNSLDSRYWGFVPEDHIVGYPWLVWFSSGDGTGIRWNRVMHTVKSLED